MDKDLRSFVYPRGTTGNCEQDGRGANIQWEKRLLFWKKKEKHNVRLTIDKNRMFEKGSVGTQKNVIGFRAGESTLKQLQTS